VDLHCHILPEIDDGAANMDESLAMARIAAHDGIRIIVATPHVNKALYSFEEVKQRVILFNRYLEAAGLDVSVLPGGDVSVVFEPSLVKDFTINSNGYILVEFPHTHMPHNAATILHNFRKEGLRPIITHPERNPTIMSRPETLLELLEDGIMVQVTAGSLTGDFGRKSQRCALFLLENDAVDIIATDAHSRRFRRPVLSAGFHVAEKIVGRARAEAMVINTPVAVIAGNPV